MVINIPKKKTSTYISNIGKTALQRAILEVERHLFGSTHDHHTFSEQGGDDGKVV